MDDIQHARSLRRNQTKAEAKLWSRLRSRRLEGLKFVRQKPIGPYVVDFACVSAKLAIELDGGQHAERTDADRFRTEQLSEEGWELLRFWNHDVLKNPDGVCDRIATAVKMSLNR